MLFEHKRATAAVVGSLAVLAVTLNPAPSSAEPDIDSVQERVDRLYHEAEAAQERYHDVKLEFDELSKDLKALKADQRRQAAKLDGIQGEVSDSVVRQYEGESISAVGQVVVSEDPRAFLGQLSTMSNLTDMQTGLFDDYNTELKALNLRKDATRERAEEVEKSKEEMASEQATVDDKLAKAEDLLADLKEEERQRLAEQAAESTTPPPPAGELPKASGGAAAAVSYALAQVGDSYVYGAAGPDAFDCSGLTMMAWAQAGVGLPHSSGAQMGSGAPVSSSALQPGDLVFYYSPVSHVGIYIGNGQIVHAANPGTGVVVAGVFSMPFSGAVRPG